MVRQKDLSNYLPYIAHCNTHSTCCPTHTHTLYIHNNIQYTFHMLVIRTYIHIVNKSNVQSYTFHFTFTLHTYIHCTLHILLVVCVCVCVCVCAHKHIDVYISKHTNMHAHTRTYQSHQDKESHETDENEGHCCREINESTQVWVIGRSSKRKYLCNR